MVWKPYSDDDVPASHGRCTLAEFLSLFFEHSGLIDFTSLEDYFANEAPKEDWITVTSTANFLGERIQSGKVRSFARPIGGGPIEPIQTSKWELDDFVDRFRTSAFDPSDWINAAAPATHYIFVSIEDVDRFLEDWGSCPLVAQATDEKPVEDKDVLRMPEVCRRTGLSRSTIYEKIGNSEFPAPIKISQRASGWLASEIATWLEERANERTTIKSA